MNALPLAIITGASSGIGKAVAKAFSAAGHPMLLIARTMPEGEFPDALCVSADVGDYAALERAVRKAEERFGPAGCLVNSAGMADARAFDAVAAADYEREIRTNLLGTMNATKAVFEGMLARQAGTIINISSISDRKTCAVSVGYTASKFGVRAVSESLREAAAKAGVRVINIAPGYIRTNIHAVMGVTFEEYKRRLGDPDFMTAEEFAGVVRWCYELPPHICVRDLVIAPTRTTF